MQELEIPFEAEEKLELAEARGKAFHIQDSHLYPTLDQELIRYGIPFEKVGRDIWVFTEQDEIDSFMIRIDLQEDDGIISCPWCGAGMRSEGEGMAQRYLCPNRSEDGHWDQYPWWPGGGLEHSPRSALWTKWVREDCSHKEEA